jgi:hypothetical protein
MWEPRATGEDSSSIDQTVAAAIDMLGSPAVAVAEAAAAVVWALVGIPEAVATVVRCGGVNELLLAVSASANLPPHPNLGSGGGSGSCSGSSDNGEAASVASNMNGNSSGGGGGGGGGGGDGCSGQLAALCFAAIARIFRHVLACGCGGSLDDAADSSPDRSCDELLGHVVNPVLAALRLLKASCDSGVAAAAAAIDIVDLLVDAGYSEHVTNQGFVMSLLALMGSDVGAKPSLFTADVTKIIFLHLPVEQAAWFWGNVFGQHFLCHRFVG